MSSLAPRIRAARGFAGLTQQELADRLGVDVQSIKRTEAGKRDPRPVEIRAIAEETGVPREFLTAGWDYQTAQEVESLAAHNDEVKAISERFFALQEDRHTEIVGRLNELANVFRAHDTRLAAVEELLRTQVQEDVAADRALRQLAQEIGTRLPADQNTDQRQTPDQAEQPPRS